MAQKAVNETKGNAPVAGPKTVQLTPENAPMMTVKMLSEIRDEMRKIREVLEKQIG